MPDAPAVYTSAALADRWAVSAAWVRELTKPGAAAVTVPLAEGTRIGSGLGGTRVWAPAEVEAFEAANSEWVSPEAVEARRREALYTLSCSHVYTPRDADAPAPFLGAGAFR